MRKRHDHKPGLGKCPSCAQCEESDKETLQDTLSVLVKHEADLQKAKRQFIAPPPGRGKPDEFGRFSGN
jgi:hypothetical protein